MLKIVSGFIIKKQNNKAFSIPDLPMSLAEPMINKDAFPDELIQEICELLKNS